MDQMNQQTEDTLTAIDYAAIEEISVFNCCRTCMRAEDNLLPVDASDEDSVSYRDKLAFCVFEIEWSKDGLSTLICHQCVSKLRIAYNFKKTCFSTDDAFKRYLLLQDEEFSNDNIENSTEDAKSSELVHPKSTLETNTEEQENVNISVDEVSLHDCSVDKKSVSKDESERDAQSESFRSNSVTDFLSESIAKESDIETSIPENITQTEFVSHLDTLEQQILSDEIDCDIKFKAEIQSQIDQLKEPLTVDSLESSDIQNNKHTSVSQPVASESSMKLVNSPSTGSIVKKTNAVQDFSAPKDKNLRVKKHKCDQCDKAYYKNANLKVHQRTHTGEKPHECHYCEKRFYSMSHLKEHIRRHTGEKPFPCEICNKRFTIRGELNMHIKSHTGEKNFPCTSCNRRCLTASDLKLHLRTHTGERPYYCEICARQFASKYVLSCHMKVHTGERPFICKICDKAFTQSSHLKVHMRKHTGEKFACKQCPKEFSHGSQLSAHNRKAHTRNSTGGRPSHKCLVCDKEFNYPGEVDAHMKKHLGEKYICVICLKEFASQRYLTEHSRIHTGKSLRHCTLCDKSFTRNQYLVKHLRIHTGEKPFECDTCGKCFTQQSTLKIHIRTHTGERPYPCTYCSKKFNTSSDLKSHLKTHYRNNVR